MTEIEIQNEIANLFKLYKSAPFTRPMLVWRNENIALVDDSEIRPHDTLLEQLSNKDIKIGFTPRRWSILTKKIHDWLKRMIEEKEHAENNKDPDIGRNKTVSGGPAGLGAC